jgi:hypothetical protein
LIISLARPNSENGVRDIRRLGDRSDIARLNKQGDAADEPTSPPLNSGIEIGRAHNYI